MEELTPACSGSRESTSTSPRRVTIHVYLTLVASASAAGRCRSSPCSTASSRPSRWRSRRSRSFQHPGTHPQGLTNHPAAIETIDHHGIADIRVTVVGQGFLVSVRHGVYPTARCSSPSAKPTSVIKRRRSIRSRSPARRTSSPASPGLPRRHRYIDTTSSIQQFMRETRRRTDAHVGQGAASCDDDGSAPERQPVRRPRTATGPSSTRSAIARPLESRPCTRCRAKTIWQSPRTGPNGGDELNVIHAGANYGWPLVSLGRSVRRAVAAGRLPRHEGYEPRRSSTATPVDRGQRASTFLEKQARHLNQAMRWRRFVAPPFARPGDGR